MKKTLLSVDLDYWGMEGQEFSFDGIHHFMKRIKAINTPIRFIESHEEIVPFLEEFQPKRIYNVDYHSDIVNEFPSKNKPFVSYGDLNEGNWANFYTQRRECIFEWRYPDYDACVVERLGRCDNLEWEPFGKIKKLLGYKNVVHKEGLQRIRWKDIGFVVICASPDWVYNRRVYNFVDAFWEGSSFTDLSINED